jgi:hypothetical protein
MDLSIENDRDAENLHNLYIQEKRKRERQTDRQTDMERHAAKENEKENDNYFYPLDLFLEQ